MFHFWLDLNGSKALERRWALTSISVKNAFSTSYANCSSHEKGSGSCSNNYARTWPYLLFSWYPIKTVSPVPVNKPTTFLRTMSELKTTDGAGTASEKKLHLHSQRYHMNSTGMLTWEEKIKIGDVFTEIRLGQQTVNEISLECQYNPCSGIWLMWCVRSTRIHPSIRQLCMKCHDKIIKSVPQSYVHSTMTCMYSATSISSTAQTWDSHNWQTLPGPTEIGQQGALHNASCTLPLLLRCELPSWCTQPSQAEDLSSLGSLPQLGPLCSGATSHRPHDMF